ncbi:MAG: rhodanese-like domain-containing protein [Actinomycetota bacterium]
MNRVEAIGDEALGNTSYLVDVGGGSALAVDPRRDTAEHLAIAERSGLRIVGVLETHLHADFVSGAREIADASGAAVYASAKAGLGFSHSPLRPGAPLIIAGAAIDVLATAGHTPEHLSFLVTIDGARLLFSGGSLIVGGAARTDLTGPERAEELARAQFASLRSLAALPDDTVLYPTHGAGSFCSTGPARTASSTIGAERLANPLFAIDDEEEFVAQLRSGFGTYPRYFAHLRAVNREGAALLQDLPEVAELPALAARDAAERGAWLIDGREAENWARAHPTGSVSITVRPAFASWLGWVVPFGAPIVLLLEPEQLEEATRLARRIGYDRIEGWTTFEAWGAAGLPVSSIETLSAEEAAERAATGEHLLDVRQANEWAARRIPGAKHLELGDIIAGKSPEASQLIVYCGHGERSSTAASLLARRGLRVANLRGGTFGWHRAGLAFES